MQSHASQPHTPAPPASATAPPNPTRAPPRPITLEDGTVVHYVSSYKYLGLRLYPDRPLTIQTYLSKLTSDLARSHARFFGYNSTLASMSPTAVVQLLKAACINNYLLSIIPPTPDNTATLNKHLRSIMRTALHGLPPSTPTVFLTVESAIPSATFLLTRALLTHFLSASTTLHTTAPAASILLSQLFSVAQTGSLAPLPPTSWLATTLSYMNSFATDLGPWATIPSILHQPNTFTPTPNSATLAALVYARQLNWLLLLREAAEAKVTFNVTLLSQTPTTNAGSKQFYTDTALLGGHHALAGLATNARATPLSTIAPGGAGVLIPQVTRPPTNPRLIFTLLAHRLGPCALHYINGPVKWLVKKRVGPEGLTYSKISRGSQCPFCPAHTASALHIITECCHPQVVDARRTLTTAATAYLPTLAGHIVSAGWDGIAPAPFPTQVALNLLRQTPTAPPDWTTPTGRNFLYRLVMALPWPAAAVDDPTAAHCRALGYLMDSTIVRNSRRHRLANSWVLWGAKSLRRMLTTWSAAVDAEP